MSKLAKGTAVILIAAMLVMPAVVGSTTNRRKYISIATGGAAGVYYPLGGALAKIYNDVLGDEVTATAEVTGASVANIRLIKRGEVELALVQNDVSYYAYNGEQTFEGKPVTKLRAIACWYPEMIQIVVLAGKGIESVQDLEGRRIGVGSPGSGTEANARQILEAYGLSYKHIKEDYLSFGEVSDHLKDRTIDGGFLTAGIPTGAVMDVNAVRSIDIVPIDPAVAQELSDRYPFYVQATIPAGTYKGLSKDVPTVAVMAMLVCSSDLDEELAYKLTKAMWENLGVMAATHARGKDITLARALDGVSIPLHPGARRYYEEIAEGMALLEEIPSS